MYKTSKQYQNETLLQHLNANCVFVDEQEQHEIDALTLDFSHFEGREVSLDEFTRLETGQNTENAQ